MLNIAARIAYLTISRFILECLILMMLLSCVSINIHTPLSKKYDIQERVGNLNEIDHSLLVFVVLSLLPFHRLYYFKCFCILCTNRIATIATSAKDCRNPEMSATDFLRRKAF